VNERLNKLIHEFHRYKIDALLVTKDENIQYLTNFPSSESWLFITPQRTFYITDFRYILEARQGLKEISVKQYSHSIFEIISKLINKYKVKSLGINERHLSVFVYKFLKRACPKYCKVVGTDNIVENFRAIKETQEIRNIEQALKIHKKSHLFLKKTVQPFLTEKEILRRLESFVRSQGVTLSFDPIVACGVNSCFPHAKVTERKIKYNDVVLIDMGIDFRGYKSDLTRMFFLGKIPNLVHQVNECVEQSQREAISHIKPGVPVAEIDRIARNLLARNRLEKFFGHALGHGVGLEVHENPRISQKDPSILRTGMVITVEPAVYIPNKFGIRIEDMVLVTKNGNKILSDDIH